MSQRKLTIGMCCYDDLEGVVWTVQMIRLNHPEVLDEIEFLILDNNPDSPHGKALAQFVKWIAEPIHCVPITEAGGTALRTRIFDMAETPYVLCVDCHVALAPGALRQLIDGLDAGRDEGNLLQGPMLADNMNIMATHMAHVWRDGMLGIWAVAWRCECGAVFQTAKREEDGRNWLGFQTMSLPHTALSTCTLCDAPFPVLRWEGHEKHLEAAGFSPAASGGPFEIPAHGLGLFACRKDAWLGFNPRFQHFGGEECYIHEKFRQAGRTTICLPFLKWWHRFWRIGGAPYPAFDESRIMNYLIGHHELGLEQQPVVDHFARRLGKNITVTRINGIPQSVSLS
jgi:hypothetical protein